jgi:methanogenic corrinoid protein MtbC1
MTNAEEIKASISSAIQIGDGEEGAYAARRALEYDMSPLHIYQECVIPTLQEIGDRFGRLEIFLPEMMLAAEAAKAVIGILDPAIRAETSQETERAAVVIGTVAGDIHDIGKNMVATMLDVSGFHVIDLGTDVATEDFVRAARSEKAEIIALSSLLTTSLPYVRDLVRLLDETDLRQAHKVMVGGGSVTLDWAASVGADGYGRDAAEAVKVARELCNQHDR